MKYITRRDTYLNTQVPMNEKFDMAGSGPMANDIEWGDSLLGRLLNSTVRKIKVGRDLLKVGGILAELEKAFQAILDQSKLRNSVSEEELVRVMIFYILRELKALVYEGEELKVLISFTENILENVKNKANYTELSDDNRSELVKELEEFLAFLKSLLGDGEDKKEDGAEDKKEDDSNKSSDTSILLRKMIINLKSLYLIALNYKKLVNVEDADSRSRVYRQQNSEQNSNQNRNDNTGTTDTDQAPEEPIETPPVNPTPAPASNPAPQPTANNESPDMSGQQLELDFNETFSYLDNLLEALGSGASPERNKIDQSEQLLRSANKNLKKSMDELVGDRYKGIAVDAKYLNNLLIRANEKENRLKIYKLYKEIHRYIIGDKEPTLQDKDSLYKESASVLLVDNKTIAVVAEKISRVSKRLLQFDKQGLTGGMGDISEPMDDFISTMKYILENIDKVNPPMGLSENRSIIITKLSDFKKIYEDAQNSTQNTLDKVQNEAGQPSNQNIEDRKASDLTKEELKTLIIEKFEQIISYEKWVIKKVELEKIEKNLEDIEKGGTYNTELDMDNFMEVLKLFNRAYKIYTTPVIPSGRGGGKVSNKTFREYQLVGSEGRGTTPDNPGYGPWRNNAVFNKFESGVLDLLKKKEYQKIFEDKTIIRTGSGELVKGGGKILLTLINNLLDGDSLYKKGEQAKFISKYFNIGDIKEIEGNEYFRGDKKEVVELSDNVMDPKDVSFKKVTDIKATERTFHVISEGDTQKYIFIYKVANSKVFIKMTESIKPFNKYLYPNFKATKGDLDKLFTGTKNIYFGEISEGDFPIAPGNTIDFKRLNISYFNKDSDRTITKVTKFKDIKGVYSLVDSEGELIKLPGDKVTDSGTNDTANYNGMFRILNK